MLDGVAMHIFILMFTPVVLFIYLGTSLGYYSSYHWQKPNLNGLQLGGKKIKRKRKRKGLQVRYGFIQLTPSSVTHTHHC